MKPKHNSLVTNFDHTIKYPKSPIFRTPTFVGGLTPIKWTPQHDRPRPRASDGEYGHVNGDLLFFIYRTADPYTKSWRSWDKTREQPFPEGETTRYRNHWNVWLYFGSGEGSHVARALKTRRQAKRTARRVLLQKIGAMLT